MPTGLRRDNRTTDGDNPDAAVVLVLLVPLLQAARQRLRCPYGPATGPCLLTAGLVEGQSSASDVLCPGQALTITLKWGQTRRGVERAERQVLAVASSDWLHLIKSLCQQQPIVHIPHSAHPSASRSGNPTLADTYLTSPLACAMLATDVAPLERWSSSRRLRKPGIASRTASMSPVYGIKSGCQCTRAHRSVASALQLLQSAADKSCSVQLLVAAHTQVLQPTMAPCATLHLQGMRKQALAVSDPPPDRETSASMTAVKRAAASCAHRQPRAAGCSVLAWFWAPSTHWLLRSR